jgi:hypothetical protein
MKIQHAAGLITAIAIAIAASSASLEAQSTNLTLYNFDTDQVSDTGYGTAWGNWFGGVFGGVVWDSTVDASNNPSSGSMQLTLNTLGSDQYVLWDGGSPTYSPLDLGTWTNLSFDIRYDVSSAIRTNTAAAGLNGSLGPGSLDFGYMRFGSRGPSFNQNWIQYFAISATNGAGLPNTNWTRVNVDLRQVTQNFSDLSAGLVDVLMGMDNGSYGNNTLVGPQIVWFDNIQLTGAIPNPPPPTLSIEKAVPALRLFGGSGQFGRSQLQVVGANESWVGGTFPVSYSFTALDNATSPGGLDYHIHFIQGTDGYSGADYTQPNVLWLQIISGSGTNTACVANVSWKTNAPSVNPDQTASGAIALTITNSVLAGTWTLTFNSNTNGTLTAPGASPVPFTLALSEDEVLTYFSNPLELRFGLQNFGNPANGGVPHDLGAITVSGTAGLQINEDFTKQGTNQLDSAVWDISHSDGLNLINLVPTNAPYWVKWTLPDSRFVLVSGASLLDRTNWNTPANVTPISQGGVRWALIPGESLPVGNSSFFALIKRSFTQLQVLLPGETNAPNTLTGKVGTPDLVTLSAGGVLNVTINAVDPTYHIVTTAPGNTISLTTTDGTAGLPVPAALVNGTVTQELFFGSTGNFTVTATNMSDVSIPNATSSPVTVNQ